jgi:hypothetical protein
MDFNQKDEKCILNESDIIEEGASIWKRSFQKPNGQLHIVPLSGGLDSRAILGGLMEAGYRDRIIVVTFGTPDTLDYEIGRSIAKNLGFSHECIDLSTIRIDQQLLLETAQNGASWTFLIDAFYNSLVPKMFGKEAIYWTGYMGDALSGAHLPPIESDSWQIAKRYFAAWNHFCGSFRLTPQSFNAEGCLPQHPLCNKKDMSFDDQLDFYIRQQCYISPVIIPKGYDYRTPFLTLDWVKFILSIPFEYRTGQYIYKKILLKAFSDLFKFPTKKNLGLPINSPSWRLFVRRCFNKGQSFIAPLYKGINPRISYVDFNHSLRKRNDMKILVRESINDLKKRGIIDWLDLDFIWKAHQMKGSNHGSTLMLLTALEVSLKSDDIS